MFFVVFLFLFVLFIVTYTVAKQDSTSFSNLISKVNLKHKISSLNPSGNGMINLSNGASIMNAQDGDKIQQNNDEKDEEGSQSTNSTRASHPRTKWYGHSEFRQRKASSISSNVFQH